MTVGDQAWADTGQSIYDRLRRSPGAFTHDAAIGAMLVARPDVAAEIVAYEYVWQNRRAR